MAILRQLAGAAGKVIDVAGSALGNPFGQGVRGVDISSTLQNWGGNVGGNIKSAIVPQAYASSGSLPSSSRVTNASMTNYSWNPSTTKDVTRSGSGGSSGGGYQEQSGGGFNFDSNLVSPNTGLGGGPSEMDAINEEYNRFNQYLDQEEGRANQNFNETKSLYDTELAHQKGAYEADRKAETEGVKKTESLNLAKVRQLLQDLQQSNAARSAITGGNSSVSEVLGERFGRRAQEGLSNVMTQAQTALERVGRFYDQAITKLNDTYSANLLSAKQTLQDNISYISQQRGASASARQNATVSAWKDYYNSVNQARVQAATFKAQYDLWKNTQDNAYGSWLGNVNSVNAEATEATKPSLLASSYGVAPSTQQLQANATNPNYYYNKAKKNTEDEEDLLATGNIA